MKQPYSCSMVCLESDSKRDFLQPPAIPEFNKEIALSAEMDGRWNIERLVVGGLGKDIYN